MNIDDVIEVKVDGAWIDAVVLSKSGNEFRAVIHLPDGPQTERNVSDEGITWRYK